MCGRLSATPHVFRKKNPDALDAQPRARPDRSWPTRIAWGVLIGGFALVLTRASIATVVRTHGAGMAPTIADGDGLLLMRGSYSIEHGDIVVYDPTPPPAQEEQNIQEDGLPGEDKLTGPKGVEGFGAGLPNTAVVDVEDVEARWGRLQRRANKDSTTGPPASYRLGRVLALPGDAVTFNLDGPGLGLAINGAPLKTEALGEDIERPRAHEFAGETRYEVFAATEKVGWPGMALPMEDGPVQLRAEGYLIVADNRDESRCCDSRALGWIPEDHVRGEIAVRIAASAPSTSDTSGRKRVQWLP